MREMKGYYVSVGYMGWIPELYKYVLFATEEEYHEYFERRTEHG